MSVAKPHNITGSRIDPKLLFLHHLEPTSFLKSLNKLRNDTCNAGPVFRELPVDATDLCAMASQDALNTAIFGNLISAVQPFVGPPMHTQRLFRKGIKKVYTPVQTHSNFSCICEPM